MSSRLALFTLTTNGFGHSADSGAGLALALWLVASHTACSISAYNVTDFSSYLFVPYHDVLKGTQSAHAFVSVVVLASLFHTTLVTVMLLSMFYTIGIEGPPMLPTFVAGVSLWVFGVFGFIALIMGLETLCNSCRTRSVFHANEHNFRLQQHPVSQEVPPTTSLFERPVKARSPPAMFLFQLRAQRHPEDVVDRKEASNVAE